MSGISAFGSSESTTASYDSQYGPQGVTSFGELPGAAEEGVNIVTLVGPPGPAGPAGDTGPAGPAGATGPAGSNTVIVTVGLGSQYDFNASSYGSNHWEAVRAAQSSLPAGGGVVEIANGLTYTIGTSASLYPRNDVLIKAQTPYGVKFTGGRAVDWLVENYSVDNSNPAEYFRMEGINFDLDNIDRASGIRLFDAAYCDVSTCRFTNGTAGSWYVVMGATNNTSNTLGICNSVQNCIFDTHAGSFGMELAFNQTHYRSINNTYTNKNWGSTGPCLELYQKMYHTVIENPKFINNNGFGIYYSNSTFDTLIKNPYSFNSGAVLIGSNISDNLNNGPLGGFNRAYNLRVENLTAYGGANSLYTSVVQLGAVDGFSIDINYADNYQIGVQFTRGNNGNILPAINGEVHYRVLKNMNAGNVAADLGPAIHFGKSNPNANITIYGGEIYDDRGTPLSIQPVFFEWSDLETTATATVSGGAVTSIAVDVPGNIGYETVPNISFSGGGGSGASAHAVMDIAANGGKILSIVVDSGGTGYSSAPTVTVQNTTQNNTYGNIRIVNASLKSYSGRSSVKKSPNVTLASTVEFMSIRDKDMGTLSAYYKEYSDGSGATPTDLSYTAATRVLASSTGADATLPMATGTDAGLSQNDYTTAEKSKLAGIATGAEVNVNADWNSASGDSEILNKPTGLVSAGTAFTNDNRLVRSDGTGLGVQASAVVLDDNGRLRFGGADGSAILDLSGVTSIIQGLRIEGDTDGAIAFSAFVVADTFLRFAFLTNGYLTWGDGTSAGDTNLYRGGANRLTTDDTFEALGGMKIGSSSTIGHVLTAVDTNGNLALQAPGGSGLSQAEVLSRLSIGF